ncbi:MAG: hypothetical protein F6K10_02430 [Moorea sp. SIO2B7]|nr:hypothetical protein [Moorena sp. SIO2B7]
MYLPPLRTISNSDLYKSGDITIHPSAAIAPGVILQAAPDSQIVIGAGVCLGMGVIINAEGGSIELEDGAILGAGVLIIGKGKIGANACLGAATTVFNASIDSLAVVSAYSLIGDTSRQVANLPEAESYPKIESQVETKSEVETKTPSPEIEPELTVEDEVTPQTSENTPEPQPEVISEAEFEEVSNKFEPESSSDSVGSPVVGKVYINNLLLTLFPQRQSFGDQNQDEQ